MSHAGQLGQDPGEEGVLHPEEGPRRPQTLERVHDPRGHPRREDVQGAVAEGRVVLLMLGPLTWRQTPGAKCSFFYVYCVTGSPDGVI